MATATTTTSEPTEIVPFHMQGMNLPTQHPSASWVRITVDEDGGLDVQAKNYKIVVAKPKSKSV